MSLDDINPSVAENALEQLRYGVPPSGLAQEFTVGRDDEIRALARSLDDDVTNSALLIHANYGTGKSHLLRVLRELALERNFAVSLIVADSQGGVRFNRMDTILGAVCRELEVPDGHERGIGSLLDLYRATDEKRLSAAIRSERNAISNNGKWDLSERLASPAMFVALRAWIHARDDHAVRNRISAWLSSPADYRSQRKLLYMELVAKQRRHFLDPRREWQFYADEVFAFDTGGYRQSWDALADLHRIVQNCGLRGLVLLVDEFEDVIQNLERRNFKEAAFLNLFRFFGGERFPGRSYFAVTPEFAQKCKLELLKRGVYDFDYERFDQLPFFRLSPIELRDLVVWAKRARRTHSLAYGWNAEQDLPDAELRALCEQLMKVESPDKVRQAIIALVHEMDTRLEEM